MVRSALALGGLRRDTDRELALPACTAVKDKLGELEATLATATRKTDGKAALPGEELARLYSEHARLSARWNACAASQLELRTAEELCLEALARDVDAVDLIDNAILQRARLRRDLFWLLTAMYEVNTGATLLVHSPDARAAVVAGELALETACTTAGRLAPSVGRDRLEFSTSDRRAVGPPHRVVSAPRGAPPAAALVRIVGAGADLLFGLGAACIGFMASPARLSRRGRPARAARAATRGPRGHREEARHHTTDGLLDDGGSPRPRHRPRRRAAARRCASSRVSDDVLVEGGSRRAVVGLPERLAEAAVARLLPALAHAMASRSCGSGRGRSRSWRRGSPRSRRPTVKINFTVGVYQAKKEGQEEWTALTPQHHYAYVQGQGEVRLRERMVERLRAVLRAATPREQELFQMPLGTELVRLPLDLKLEGGRVTGKVPLVVEPRWTSDRQQQLFVYHPERRTEWFLAEDRNDVETLAPVFLRQFWKSLDEGVEGPAVERQGSPAGDRVLDGAAVTARPAAVPQEDTRAAAFAPRPEQVLQQLALDETHRAVQALRSVPRSPYRERLGYLLGGHGRARSR
jgi:hypothetical protein